MPLLTRTSARSLHHSLCAGAYFTDGIRLYRVVASLADPWSGGQTVELEDCLSLETAVYPLDAITDMRLKLARAAEGIT
ncbi:MAG TPA: hypothetical protein VIG37_06085 [Methylomirabilota bacterium]